MMAVIDTDGFEGSADGWTLGTGWSTSSANPRTGSDHIAYDDGNSGGSATKTFSIPAGYTSVTFSLYCHNQSAEATLNIKVNGTTGATVPTSNGSYTQYTVNLPDGPASVDMTLEVPFHLSGLGSALSVDDVSVEGTLSVTSTGTADITLDPVALATAGGPGVDGAAAVTMQSVLLAAESYLDRTASAEVALDGVTLASSGGNANYGEAAITLADVALSAASTGDIDSDATLSLADATLTAAGNAAGDAASIYLDDVSVTLAGTVTVPSDAGIVLDGITLLAVSAIEVAATATITLDSVSLLAIGNNGLGAVESRGLFRLGRMLQSSTTKGSLFN